mgnify:FL=1
MDANVLILAYHLKPRYTSDQVEMKKRAKNIAIRIDEGEEVATSVIQLSEAANVLSHAFEPQKLSVLLKAMATKENLKIFDCSREEYLAAIEQSEETGVGVNDCLAHVLMLANGITEIYSFDKDFDKFSDIKRLEK